MATSAATATSATKGRCTSTALTLTNNNNINKNNQSNNYVSVFDCDVSEKNKKKTTFKFVICYEGHKFVLCRRYSDFYRLCDKVSNTQLKFAPKQVTNQTVNLKNTL